MGWQIIKQPNGKYCIFSSVVDNVIYYNATPEEVVNAFVKQEADRIALKVNEIIDLLERGGNPYLQFTKSFDDIMSLIKDIHGSKEVKKLKDMIHEE